MHTTCFCERVDSGQQTAFYILKKRLLIVCTWCEFRNDYVCLKQTLLFQFIDIVNDYTVSINT